MKYINKNLPKYFKPCVANINREDSTYHKIILENSNLA